MAKPFRKTCFVDVRMSESFQNIYKKLLGIHAVMY